MIALNNYAITVLFIKQNVSSKKPYIPAQITVEFHKTFKKKSEIRKEKVTTFLRENVIKFLEGQKPSNCIE